MATKEENRERFCSLLRSTGRENIEYVIEDLETFGFFDAPASSRNHFNYPGGLVAHSLSVHDTAMALRESVLKMRPDIEPQLPVNSIIIATLLHDTCKADIYRITTRKRKNEVGIWEDVEEYEIDYSGLPVGHGEKSVIRLLRMGLDLEDEEILAIRWHMGAWDVDRTSYEQDRSYREAVKKSPLVALVHSADTLSAQIIENE